MNLVDLYRHYQYSKLKQTRYYETITVRENNMSIARLNKNSVNASEVYCSIYRSENFMFHIKKTFHDNMIIFDPPLQAGDIIELSYMILEAKK